MMAASAINSSSMPSSPNGKRKRGQNDQGGRDLKIPNNNNNQDAAADFSFLQAIQDMPGPDGSAQTAQAALAAPMSHSQYPDSFDTSAQLPSFDDGQGNGVNSHMSTSAAQALYDARQQQQLQKPAVGTTQWHQQRKDNHKEVERRRREVINEGIENIAKIVPGTEKNKGAILARTCVYIAELKQKEASFDNERRLFDATLSELTARHDETRRNLDITKAEARKWQRRCREAGLTFDDFDLDLDGHDVDPTANGIDSGNNAFDATDGTATNV